MKVYIVGLGLIGASYAESLNDLGHTVYGFDQDPAVVDQALKEKLIETSHPAMIGEVDLVIIALYPKATIEFITTHAHQFKVGQIITDVTGIKKGIVTAIEAMMPKGVHYVSHHPMAGKEHSGYAFKDKALFYGANAIVIKTCNTAKTAASKLKECLLSMGFKSVTDASIEEHDQKVAYTSQLPHALAMALVNLEDDDTILRFTGNSFRDLTRIALINEVLWGDVFIENRHILTDKIARLVDELTMIKTLLERSDKEELLGYMQAVKKKRDSYGRH